MALPWNGMTPQETDVNSGVSQTIGDKLRTNLDNLRARVRDTPTDANWVAQAHLKTALQEVFTTNNTLTNLTLASVGSWGH